MSWLGLKHKLPWLSLITENYRLHLRFPLRIDIITILQALAFMITVHNDNLQFQTRWLLCVQIMGLSGLKTLMATACWDQLNQKNIFCFSSFWFILHTAPVCSSCGLPQQSSCCSPQETCIVLTCANWQWAVVKLRRQEGIFCIHSFLFVCIFFCSSFLFCLCFGVLLDGGLLIASLYMTRHLYVGTSFYILNLSDSLAAVV